jgi:hypothetical protein
MDAFLLAKMSSHPQRNQIANEDTVEKIVRKRSLEGMFSTNLQLEPCRRLMLVRDICSTNDRSVCRADVAFKSRCRFFLPPERDERGRQWWDAAEKTQ